MPCHSTGDPGARWVTCGGSCVQELVYLPQYLDLLCGMTAMYHDELTARSSLKANDVIRVR